MAEGPDAPSPILIDEDAKDEAQGREKIPRIANGLGEVLVSVVQV